MVDAVMPLAGCDPRGAARSTASGRHAACPALDAARNAAQALPGDSAARSARRASRRARERAPCAEEESASQAPSSSAPFAALPLRAQATGWQEDLAGEIDLHKHCKVSFLSQVVERTV